jgi:hypothetical protein
VLLIALNVTTDDSMSIYGGLELLLEPSAFFALALSRSFHATQSKFESFMISLSLHEFVL